MAAAAALRLFLRRRAPPPLFPASTASYAAKSRSPLRMASSAAGGLRAVRREQFSTHAVPSVLTRCYSSKVCTPPPQRQPTERRATRRLKKLSPSPIDCQETQGLKQDYKEWNDMMKEALETYGKLDDILKDVVLSEKWLDHFAETIGNSKRLSPDKLQQNQMICKEMEDFHKAMRQNLEELSSSYKTLKTMTKLNKGIITVGLGACILLIPITIGICLA